MNEEKITKAVSIEREIIKHIEKNHLITNFSEWICNTYRKEFMEIETLSKKMQEYTDKVNQCIEEIRKLKKEATKKVAILKPIEIKWIREEAQRRIKRTTFEGVYKFFIRHFNRKDINRKQFRLFVERLKTEK